MSSATLVAGPPGAGKSAFVAARWAAGDVVFDYDRVFQAISLLPFRSRADGVGTYVEAMRAAFAAHAEAARARAWLVAGAPRAEDRDFYRRRGWRVVVVWAELELCRERLEARGETPAVDLDGYFAAFESAAGDELVEGR